MTRARRRMGWLLGIAWLGGGLWPTALQAGTRLSPQGTGSASESSVVGSGTSLEASGVMLAAGPIGNWVGPGLATQPPVSHHLSPGVDSLVKALADLGEELTTVECDDAISTLDVGKDGVTRVGSRLVHLRYGRSVGRLREDILALTNSPEGISHGRRKAAPTVPFTRYRPQALPDPAWLFAIPEALRQGQVTITHQGAFVTAHVFKPGQKKAVPFLEVTFGANHLPVALRTFGVRHVLLDEYQFTWQPVGRFAYLASVHLVAHSRENTVTVSHVYSNVVINAPVSATVFGTP